MEENFNGNSREIHEESEKQSSAASYSWNAPPSSETAAPVMLRRKIKGGYNWSGGILLIQLLIAAIISFIASFAISTAVTAEIMAANPEITQQELITKVNEQVGSSGSLVVILNAVSYLIGNTATFLFVLFAAKRFKAKSLLAKPSMTAGNIALGIVSALGIQGVSLVIQMITMQLTQKIGVSEETAAALSFSDNTLSNIVLILYAVILGPITEELLLRGLALNLLAPVNRKFALIASSILFGLMHGNFNQMFNGFLLGLILGYIALKSGSIIPSVICHIIVNANAMFCSYFYEYRMLENVGEEKASLMETVHIVVMLVIGLVALVFFLKKNGAVKSTDIITAEYTYEVEPAEEAALKWKAFLKSPAVIIAAVIYIAVAVFSIRSV